MIAQGIAWFFIGLITVATVVGFCVALVITFDKFHNNGG